ncbi:MAG: dihydrodipicolinate synthase family protein [Candidatus Marinimicrobia bacterium]|jgi:4-hydroxy-tetrahydrodipicolinate synthase|nr:dihydrodipicolinate synthase family protein [Candidatus Neomarinimicrobiota bacterium]MBT3675278.1 dihydrodipicolinate synthase family protein [Candidatus Neomarinimicrobiota bacterium]MBT3763269.1 dihydrodipicolinate synthase family protein [Candidatus Neomarinimicrobiota bacterium]MBT4068764.1 dihydrodipicolinate synthase family protein [Candidatus Neomarinimicrobiota bacterium]MBT4270562.1 dihydrodipicolinate synthase family protein [Candidatus Neomarinimicrobiota bacterium]
MKPEWKGVYPALTTKFTNDDQLDIPAFLHNIEFQIESGVHGCVIGGSLGEASTLTQNEKVELLIAAVGHINDRIPVIMNIAEQSTTDAVSAAQNAQVNGADGLMMLPPMRYPSDSRETVEFYKAVATSCDLPIMTYNNPIDYKIEITIPMFEELLKLDSIEATKESTRDVTNVTRMRNAFGNDIKILCGVDTLALEELALGADGWVAGLVDAFPRETVVIYELVQQDRLKEAREIYRWFMPLLELDIHPKLVQYIKLAEVATGIGTEPVRPPRLPLVGEERTRVQKIINDALAIRPEMPSL